MLNEHFFFQHICRSLYQINIYIFFFKCEMWAHKCFSVVSMECRQAAHYMSGMNCRYCWSVVKMVISRFYGLFQNYFLQVCTGRTKSGLWCKATWQSDTSFSGCLRKMTIFIPSFCTFTCIIMWIPVFILTFSYFVHHAHPRVLVKTETVYFPVYFPESRTRKPPSLFCM